MKISVKSEQREKRIEVNVNIFVEMFVRATRRRENGGRKHEHTRPCGTLVADRLTAYRRLTAFPSLRLTHSTNPRGGFSTARLRGPRVHTHGAERGNQADTRVLTRSKKRRYSCSSSLSIFSFSPLFCLQFFR